MSEVEKIGLNINETNDSQFNLSISEKAKTRLKIIAKSNKEKPYVRIIVDGGGCSGLQYEYEVTNEILKDDIIIKTDEDNIVILVDKLSSKFLNNATLDYISNLSGSFFKLENPNASKKCGCGKSFSIF